MSRLKKVDPKFFTEEDLVAVKSGVEKWAAVVAGTYDGDLDDCALCELSTERFSIWGCEGCALEQAHKGGCSDHFIEVDQNDSTYHARALLGHLQNIQRQIEKGLS